jgi:hypothetical protein
VTPSRKPLPSSTVADLLVATRRRCCLCYFLKDDHTQKRVQIAHIDRKRNNDSPSNLVPLCLDHHDEYDSRTSQSKGIIEEELLRYKEMLIKDFEGNKAEKEIEVTVEDRKVPALGSELFYGYGTLFANVTRILFRYDPVGINFGHNEDEYDPEAHDIIRKLQDNNMCAPTTHICKTVFAFWFDPEIAEGFTQYEKMANDIDAAWNHFKERLYVYSGHAS